MSPNSFGLNLWRWRWRELWQGHLWPIIFALVLIVASVFALTGLTERVEQLLVTQSRAALAGDMVLVSSTPIDPNVYKQAKALNLKQSQQVRFNTMLFHGDEMALVTVKSVDAQFPLRGALTLSSPDTKAAHLQPNEIWLNPTLFSTLSLKHDHEVMLGDAIFRVSGEVTQDPEWSFNPFRQRAVVFIHESDLLNTGAIQPGSRVSYRAYFRGDDSALSALKSQLTLTKHQKWLDENTQSRTGDWLLKTRQYLSITLMMVIVLASVTLFLTLNHYGQTRKATMAMMKSLGATRGFLWRWLVGQIGLLFSIGLGLGWLCGVLLEMALRWPLTSVLPQTDSFLGIAPFVISVLVAMTVAIPALGIPLWRLVEAPAISVVQSQQQWPFDKRGYLLALLPIIALFSWFRDQWLLWGIAFLLIFLLGFLALLGLLFVKLLRANIQHGHFSLALRRIERDPWSSGFQLAALSASLMLVTVIALLRTEILADWEKTLPLNAPNVFAINLADDEKQSYLNALDGQSWLRSAGYPIFRGRLVANNDVLFSDSRYRHDESLRRELSLTWQNELPENNQLIAGKWGFSDSVSVEEGVAKRLGIQLGDRLMFSIYGQNVTAQVTNFRQVEWRNMQPNFYFVFSPDVLRHFSATWLVSFRVEEGDQAFLTTLAKAYPTVSLMDVRQLSANVQKVLDKLSIALSILAWVAVLSGLLLMITLLKLNLRKRYDELHLYRILGASRRQLRQTLWFEYGSMALLAGGMASLGAFGILSLILTVGFSLPIVFVWELVLLPFMSLLLVLLVVQRTVVRLSQV